MVERRLIRRADTTAKNEVSSVLTTSTEVITPNTWTPILAVTITPKNQDTIFILARASLSMKGLGGYGKVRMTLTQGGQSNIIFGSEGNVDPLGGHEYMYVCDVGGLSLGDAVGITLEAQPVGETLVVDWGWLGAIEF